jgi:hypothetical protein
LNTPGDNGPVELERELLGVDVRQHVGQVAGVERDRRLVALDRRLDCPDVVADLGVGADSDARIAVAADLSLTMFADSWAINAAGRTARRKLLAIEDRPACCDSAAGTCW